MIKLTADQKLMKIMDSVKNHASNFKSGTLEVQEDIEKIKTAINSLESKFYTISYCEKNYSTAPYSEGDSLMFVSIIYGNEEITKFLIENKKQQLNVLNQEGLNAIFIALVWEENRQKGVNYLRDKKLIDLEKIEDDFKNYNHMNIMNESKIRQYLNDWRTIIFHDFLNKKIKDEPVKVNKIKI